MKLGDPSFEAKFSLSLELKLVPLCPSSITPEKYPQGSLRFHRKYSNTFGLPKAS